MTYLKRNSTLLKIILLALLIPLGFYTKGYTGFGSEFVHNYLGGIIYVIFWIIFLSVVFYKTTPIKIALWIFLVTSAIEFTQLVHTPYLDYLREYFLFRALFGSTFNPVDFVGYFIGAIVGLIIIKRLSTNK